MTLAVATNNPSAVAETYVRQHMRLICPGATVAVGLECSGRPDLGIPLFCIRDPRRGLVGKSISLMTLLQTGYSAALSVAAERELEDFFVEHGVTVVLAEFGTTGCALRRLCRRMRLPLYVNFHGYDATVLGQRRDIRHAYRLLARDAQGFICGSRHFAGVLERLDIPASKISVVPCGIELDGFVPGMARDPNLVIAIGRLTRKKRPDLAIRAFAKARDKVPRLRMEVIGDGPERRTCEGVIDALGLGGAVTLHGARPHEFVKSRLAAAGLFIQHSVTAENGDQESQGISLLEAMASGLPTVVTDHNGFSETVLHGKTGFLVPEHDVDAMASAIAEIAQNPEMVSELGRNGRARVEREFDAHKLAATLRSLLMPEIATPAGNPNVERGGVLA